MKSGVDMYKRSLNYPWQKRMAVSDNITRRETEQIAKNNEQSNLFNADCGYIDDSEEFFENLAKKMDMEHFMPCDKIGKSKKRMLRLWNAENANTTNKKKRIRDNKMSTKFILPKFKFSGKRMLPLKSLNNHSIRRVDKVENVVQKERQQQQPQRKLSEINLTVEENDLKEITNPRFMNSDPNSSISSIFFNESFNGIQDFDDCGSSILTQDNSRHDIISKVSPPRHCDKTLKYYKNSLWNSSPWLPTIEKNYESLNTMKNSLLEAFNMEYDFPLQLTPPSSTKSANCQACNIDQIGFYESLKNDYSFSFSGDSLSDREILRIGNKHLFT